MAHSYRKDGPGGLIHVTLGVGIIMAVGLFTNFPGAFSLVDKEKAAPRMIVTRGHADADCQANTVDTIIGTIGCGGTRRAIHLEKTTFVSAVKPKN